MGLFRHLLFDQLRMSSDRTDPVTKFDLAFVVMAGLEPAIHAFRSPKTEMPGTSPGMTVVATSWDDRAAGLSYPPSARQ